MSQTITRLQYINAVEAGIASADRQDAASTTGFTLALTPREKLTLRTVAQSGSRFAVGGYGGCGCPIEQALGRLDDLDAGRNYNAFALSFDAAVRRIVPDRKSVWSPYPETIEVVG